jgi:peptidoglycan-N-acetylglucosamine deacetylase
MRGKYCIITNDVETTSILNHCLSEKAGDLVLIQGMPRLLDLYRKYGVKSTFFYNGDIIQQHPEVVTMVLNDGHEVASHGWVHDSDKAFDVLTLDEQIEHLRLSKQLLEKISGEKIYSFRAPALRINEDTSLALKQQGFFIDSSVSSQRMDMFFSFGGVKKMSWLLAPRKPYFSDLRKLWRKGRSSILEIPVSAFVLGYIGTTLRIIPNITVLLRYILHVEAVVTGKPIVFLTHPNEFIDEDNDKIRIKRRAKSFISYIIGDWLRHKLKLKNLGVAAVPLFENELRFFKKKGYIFVTCKEYYNIFNKHHETAN